MPFLYLSENSMFKPYNSKPVIRMSVEITEDCVEYMRINTYAYKGVQFNAFKQPVVGDFICRLTEEDTYHVERSVFEERNEMFPSDGAQPPTMDRAAFEKAFHQWHTAKMDMLKHFRTMPEGVVMEVDGEAALIMSGDVLKGFCVGLDVSMSEFGPSPFGDVPETGNGQTIQ